MNFVDQWNWAYRPTKDKLHPTIIENPHLVTPRGLEIKLLKMSSSLTEDYVHYRFPGEIQEFSPSQFLISKLVEFAGSKFFPLNSMKVLDYGCGPNPMFASSLSPVAKDIVLAEFDESHRQFLEDWLTEKPGTHDWSFYFQYIRDQQKKRNGIGAEVTEEDVRKKISAIVPCDIQHEFISKEHEGPYDIALSSLCLEAACKNMAQYNEAMKKLVSLVKPGGYVLIFSTIRENADVGYYFVKNVKFFDLALQRKCVLEAMQSTGLTLLQEETFQCLPSDTHNTDYLSFFVMQK